MLKKLQGIWNHNIRNYLSPYSNFGHGLQGFELEVCRQGRRIPPASCHFMSYFPSGNRGLGSGSFSKLLFPKWGKSI